MLESLTLSYTPVPVNTSEPKYPDYVPKWWVKSIYHWEKTLDWTGFLDDLDFKNKYLSIVPSELEQDRLTRLQADSPEPYFKDAVEDHASIFQQFEINEDAPATLIDNQNNVDMQGSDMWQWMSEPLNALFRDGGAILGVDMPPVSTEAEMRQQRRPRLFWVPMRDISWPEYRNYDGVPQLSKIAIRRGQTKTDAKGHLIEYNEYWVYELDESKRCTLTVWEKDENEQWTTGQPKAITAANGQSLDRIPVTDKFSFLGDINFSQERQMQSPFADILALNQEHYNAKSEYNTVRRKTALPTPVREWINGVPENPPPFTVGSSKSIEMAAGAKVYFLELQGSSLPELRQRVHDLEGKIMMRDNKLFHISGSRSATEADIENQKAKVSLPGIRMLIESAVQDLFTIWEMFANPTPQLPVGTITISSKALESKPQPADIQSVYQGVLAAIVPPKAALNKLIRMGEYEMEDFEKEPPVQVVQQSTDNALPVDPNQVIV